MRPRARPISSSRKVGMMTETRRGDETARTTRAIELWYVVHTAIGFLCMWVFVRRELGLSRPASLVASAMWAFAGVHNQHLTGGHLVWVPYLYYPLALFFWRRAERDLRMAV